MNARIESQSSYYNSSYVEPVYDSEDELAILPEPTHQELLDSHIIDEEIGEIDIFTRRTSPEAYYLQEIRGFKLLTAQDEKRLFTDYDKGRASARKLAREFIEEGETVESLDAQVQKGMEARRIVWESNQRLIVSVAKKYLGKGMPLLDLVQVGNIGLERAIEKFEVERGYKFSTYATWWVRQAVIRTLSNDSRTIRIPVHKVEDSMTIARKTQEFFTTNNRYPSEAELAEELGVTIQKIKNVLYTVSLQPISLNNAVGEDDETELGDIIPDRSTLGVVDTVARAILQDQVQNILKKNFNKREIEVANLKFGLNDGRPHTLKEIGDKFGVTRERIRQILENVLEVLRTSKDVNKQLRDFYDES